MTLARKGFDTLYDLIKPVVFHATRKDPENAHELFVKTMRWLNEHHLDQLVLDNSSNHLRTSLPISNAAGFNKNADIPPITLQYLGFDRVVIGTVTADEWEGNPRPRIIRFPKTDSMVNWMGLPGIGAKAVYKRLMTYKSSTIPLTINLMATPGKIGNELLEDIANTMQHIKNAPNVDRFELNISCPNTHSSTGGMNARDEYQQQLDAMLNVIEQSKYKDQTIYIKVSPDIARDTAQDIIDVTEHHDVAGFTTTNTTTDHDAINIPQHLEQGGASGDAVCFYSKLVQSYFANTGKQIIACGGIKSVERAEQRVAGGADEIQLYTPLIFKGPRLVRKLRDHFNYLTT